MCRSPSPGVRHEPTHEVGCKEVKHGRDVKDQVSAAHTGTGFSSFLSGYMFLFLRLSSLSPLQRRSDPLFNPSIMSQVNLTSLPSLKSSDFFLLYSQVFCGLADVLWRV